MRLSLSLGLVLVLGCVALGKNLDLTPKFMTTHADGVVLRRPYFSDGENRYGFKVDNDLRLSGDPSAALIEFTKIPGASIRLRQSQFTPAQVFGEHREKYALAARTLVPQGAAGVTLQGEMPDAYPLNDWKSHQFTFQYSAEGQKFQTSIAFVNFDADQQLVLQVTAPENQYAQVAGRNWRILNSWYLVAPVEIVGEN